MALPTSFWSTTYADNTVKSNGEPETTSTSIPITTLTAANVVAQAALIADLNTAIEALVLGHQVAQQTVFDRPVYEKIPADSNLAQRENKWLVRYHGATTFQKFQVTIGTADLSLLPDGSEFLDLTDGEGLAFKTAFQAIAKSPNNGAENTVVDSIQFVGRNS